MKPFCLDSSVDFCYRHSFAAFLVFLCALLGNEQEEGQQALQQASVNQGKGPSFGANKVGDSSTVRVQSTRFRAGSSKNGESKTSGWTAGNNQSTGSVSMSPQADLAV